MEAAVYTGNIRANGAKVNYIPEVEADEMFSLDTTGFCVNCGEEQDGVEPDGRECGCESGCESCGERTVYGIEELMVMGLVEIV